MALLGLGRSGVPFRIDRSGDSLRLLLLLLFCVFLVCVCVCVCVCVRERVRQTERQADRRNTGR